MADQAAGQINEQLLALRNGSPDAFPRILDSYAPLITSILARYAAGSESDTDYQDDLRQEALLALYSAALTFDTEQDCVSFGLYAKICIGNRVISAVRKHNAAGSRMADMSPEEWELCLRDEDGDPSLRLDEKEGARLLSGRIFAFLSDYERVVFSMYVRDMRPAEIAASLGKTCKSVENALTRIRSKLRRVL